MKLTPKNKSYIDGLNVYRLLEHWRFAPVGDSWFQGETGNYWIKRLSEVRNRDNDAYVAASKELSDQRGNMDAFEITFCSDLNEANTEIERLRAENVALREENEKLLKFERYVQKFGNYRASFDATRKEV